MATLELPDHGKNLSNKSDFNEALEHNLDGKTSEKDRFSPEKKHTALNRVDRLRFLLFVNPRRYWIETHI